MHDAVALREYESALPPIPDDSLADEEDSVKIVSLVKTKEPFVSNFIYLYTFSNHSLKM